jgi:hypothetical protein
MSACIRYFVTNMNGFSVLNQNGYGDRIKNVQHDSNKLLLSVLRLTNQICVETNQLPLC